MLTEKFDAFGCYVAKKFAPTFETRICYVVSAFDYCQPKAHAIQLIISLEDLKYARAFPWDSVYNRIYNAFVDVHRQNGQHR